MLRVLLDPDIRVLTRVRKSRGRMLRTIALMERAGEAFALGSMDGRKRRHRFDPWLKLLLCLIKEHRG